MARAPSLTAARGHRLRNCDPAPFAHTLHFAPKQNWEIDSRFIAVFSQDQEVGSREWSKMAVPKSSSSQLESRRSRSDPTSGVSRPTAGSILPVFSLISHKTLKSAGFILWQFRACFLKDKQQNTKVLASPIGIIWRLPKLDPRFKTRPRCGKALLNHGKSTKTQVD